MIDVAAPPVSRPCGNATDDRPFPAAPSPPSRELAIAQALAHSRLEPRRRLDLAPHVLEAFERRAELLRAALAPPIAGDSLAEGAWRERLQEAPEAARERLGRLPPFALALALEDLAAGAADILRRAEARAAPFRAELHRLETILAAARLPAPPPRAPAAERKRHADALRRAFGIRPNGNADCARRIGPLAGFWRLPDGCH